MILCQSDAAPRRHASSRFPQRVSCVLTPLRVLEREPCKSHRLLAPSRCADRLGERFSGGVPCQLPKRIGITKWQIEFGKPSIKFASHPLNSSQPLKSSNTRF